MQMNPVIEKELKIKMRGWKAPTLITVYLLFLGLIVFFSFLGNKIFSPQSIDAFHPRTALSAYTGVAGFQLFLLIFIAPALTASAISGERERQTLDLLMCTNLSTFTVVTGKLFSSVAHILLLIAASLPIMATVFLFGGIQLTDLLLLFGFYLVTALFLGSIGVYFSTLFKRNSVSMVVAYITTLTILFGTLIIYGIWTSYYMRNHNQPPDSTFSMFFFFANPLYGFQSLIEGTDIGAMSMIDILGIFGRFGGYPGGTASTVNWPEWFKYIKPWMVNASFYIVASAILIILSSWRIKPVKRGFLRRKPKPVK